MQRRMDWLEAVAGRRVRDVRHATNAEDALKVAPCWLLDMWLREAGEVMAAARGIPLEHLLQLIPDPGNRNPSPEQVEAVAQFGTTLVDVWAVCRDMWLADRELADWTPCPR